MTESSTQGITWRVPRAPAAFAWAREVTRTVLTRWGCDAEGIDSVVLLVSELVTNAHRHGRTDADLRLRASRDGVRVAVDDEDPAPPVRRSPDLVSGTGGLGLHILERLSSRWGVEPHGGGKRVWADVPCRFAVTAGSP
ncbi:ATP-binding protein [Streptomyces sp. TRM 70351]|uniref:ATP-binding protein n=1 Tax=Streptomyces sp. TRM 70351 TaxID=3116552 RepID=UPI002E7B97D4|nr:ATP-binding protein [Streptomyces sp. TRM 70351]MEE1929651.1 ATP-binding protein [Streptomyces sp. TRM 70351]